MKAKYSIGQLVKWKTEIKSNSVLIDDGNFKTIENISEITSIEYDKESIIYHFKNEQLKCFESDVVASYTMDKVRAKRNSKKKIKTITEMQTLTINCGVS